MTSLQEESAPRRCRLRRELRRRHVRRSKPKARGRLLARRMASDRSLEPYTHVTGRSICLAETSDARWGSTRTACSYRRSPSRRHLEPDRCVSTTSVTHTLTHPTARGAMRYLLPYLT